MIQSYLWMSRRGTINPNLLLTANFCKAFFSEVNSVNRPRSFKAARGTRDALSVTLKPRLLPNACSRSLACIHHLPLNELWRLGSKFNLKSKNHRKFLKTATFNPIWTRISYRVRMWLQKFQSLMPAKRHLSKISFQAKWPSKDCWHGSAQPNGALGNPGLTSRQTYFPYPSIRHDWGAHQLLTWEV